MQYGIINLAIVPLHEEPAHRAQLVSQLLFGESFKVLETQDLWLKIETETDHYIGWMQTVQGILISKEEHEIYVLKEVLLTQEPVTIIRKKDNNTLLYLPAGSYLRGLNNQDLKLNDIDYELIVPIQSSEPDLIKYAHTFLNTPYLWGGRTHFGIDCSGFAQAVYRSQKIQLNRDAWQQAEQGKTVDFLQSALPGDLAFFDNEAGRITHVGIMLNNEQIIHASGRVKIDRIDDEGIYAADQHKYTHKLRIIKRYL